RSDTCFDLPRFFREERANSFSASASAFWRFAAVILGNLIAIMSALCCCVAALLCPLQAFGPSADHSITCIVKRSRSDQKARPQDANGLPSWHLRYRGLAVDFI